MDSLSYKDSTWPAEPKRLVMVQRDDIRARIVYWYTFMQRRTAKQRPSLARRLDYGTTMSGQFELPAMAGPVM